MNAQQLTMTHIETEDYLVAIAAGKDTDRKISLRNPDQAQCSVGVVDEGCETESPCEGRVAQNVHRRAVTSKTSQRVSSSPTLDTLGSR